MKTVISSFVPSRREFSCWKGNWQCRFTLAFEDGVPGAPPGIIGVEGVPVTIKYREKN